MRSRLVQATAVSELVARLGQAPEPEALRAALADALGRPVARAAGRGSAAPTTRQEDRRAGGLSLDVLKLEDHAPHLAFRGEVRHILSVGPPLRRPEISLERVDVIPVELGDQVIGLAALNRTSIAADPVAAKARKLLRQRIWISR